MESNIRSVNRMDRPASHLGFKSDFGNHITAVSQISISVPIDPKEMELAILGVNGK